MIQTLNEEEKAALILHYARLAARSVRLEDVQALSELKEIEKSLGMTAEEILASSLPLDSIP